MTDEFDYEPEDPCMPWQPALPERSLAAALAERLAELIGAALTENPVVLDVAEQADQLAATVWEHYSHTEPLAELKDALRQREGWLVGEYVLAFEFLTPEQQQGIYTMTITSEGPLQPRHRLARVLCHQLDAEGPFDPHPERMP